MHEMPLVYTIDYQWNAQCLLQLVFLNLVNCKLNLNTHNQETLSIA